MATMPKSQPIKKTEFHEYHADAQLLSGHLQRPVEREIDEQAFVSLKGRRDRHFFQRAERYSADGLISFESGYTRVSGSHAEKHGWVTLATAVLEGLNVLEVITADRVVAQVSTEHPPEDGHVPSVTFLGTRFENLRISGYPVDLEFDLGIYGDKPAHDRPYSEDSDFLDRMQRQGEGLASILILPGQLRVQYDRELKHLAEVRKRPRIYGEGYKSTLKCSLVKSVGAIPTAQSFGNVLEIPGFGTVTLAKVEIEQTGNEDSDDNVTTYFDLTMLDIKMGSVAEGSVQAVNVGANGKTRP